MNKNILFLLFIGLLVISGSSYSAESLYPVGYEIESNYQINASEISITDTLIITRTVNNNGSHPITGLYFSENFPPEFNIISELVTINGESIQCSFQEEEVEPIIPGYITCHWVVDNPGIGENILLPGDNLTFVLKIGCDDVGSYPLPLHSTVFYYDGIGFFSYSEVITVDFLLSLDNNESDPGTIPLPDRLLSVTAKPNPFNGSTVIEYAGGNLTGKTVRMELYNIIGQRILIDETVSVENNGQFIWYPGTAIGSGIYFYRVTADNVRQGGKLIYLK